MHNCDGTWQLIPELSFYEEGGPPKTAVYKIRVTDAEAQFILSWTQQDDKEVSMQFGGIADGTPRDVEYPKGAQASYSIIDQQTLDSTMYINGVEMAYARRVASNDGKLLSVLQSNMQPDGTKIRITQVYRKMSE